MIPLLVTVQEDKPDSFPPGSRHRVPHVAAGGTATTTQCHIPVNGIAAGTGRIIAPRLNAIQRFVRMGNAAVSCKMPAHVLDIGRSGCVCTIGLISAGHLVIQPGGVVAVVGKVEQHNAVLGGGVGIHTQNAVI